MGLMLPLTPIWFSFRCRFVLFIAPILV
jgi:hypothetical protein